MMVKDCCVPNCINGDQNNKHGKVKFHHFPQDPKLRKVWLERIGNPKLMKMKNKKLQSYLVCHRHFHISCKIATCQKLRKNSLPVQYLSCYKLKPNRRNSILPKDIFSNASLTKVQSFDVLEENDKDTAKENGKDALEQLITSSENNYNFDKPFKQSDEISSNKLKNLSTLEKPSDQFKTIDVSNREDNRFRGKVSSSNEINNTLKDCHIDSDGDVEFDEDIEALTDFKFGTFMVPPSNLDYWCTICFEFYKSLKALQKHKKIMHKPKRISTIHRCDPCNLTFQTRHHLFTHMCTHRKIQCHICGRHYLQYYFNKHMKVHLPDRKEKLIEMNRCYRRLCSQCGKIMHKDHMPYHLPCSNKKRPNTFNCDKCSFTTKYNTSIIRHKKLHEKDLSFKCEFCEYAAIQKSTVDDHIIRFHKELPNNELFQCANCDEKFKLKYDLMQHAKLAHNVTTMNRFGKTPGIFKNVKRSSKVYTCEICYKTFKTQKYFVSHAKKHGCTRNNDLSQIPIENFASVSEKEPTPKSRERQTT